MLDENPKSRRKPIRNAEVANFGVGDDVLVKNLRKRNKPSAHLEDRPYKLIKVKLRSFNVKGGKCDPSFFPKVANFY